MSDIGPEDREVYVIPEALDIRLNKGATCMDDDSIRDARQQLINQLVKYYPNMPNTQRVDLADGFLPAYVEQVNAELQRIGGFAVVGTEIMTAEIEYTPPAQTIAN